MESLQQAHSRESTLDNPAHFTFDRQLMQRKIAIVEEIVKNESESQDILASYPSQAIQKQVARQLKSQQQLSLHKTSETLYFGETCNEHCHGYGLLIYRNLNIRFYEGTFQNNCKYGYGLEFINGDVYVGNFVNSKPEDPNGIFIWANQDVYHGCFVNGMKHGTGKWQSGEEFYSGAWKYNRPEGEGYIKSSLSEYSGQVKNGYKHGRGAEVFSNGDRYQGEYSNGKPEGTGAYFWNNGSVYKGQFKNGLRYGEGVWQLGSEQYQGGYVNDKRNGQGKYTWAGGSYYKGHFVDDLRHGFGEMHWEKGSYYKGEWFEGTQHGQGEVYEKNRLMEKGVYENGCLKVEAEKNDDRRRHISPSEHFTRKSVSTKPQQPLPSVVERKKFNSFHRQSFQTGSFHLKKSPRAAASSPIDHTNKANEAMLERRREINNRYTRVDRTRNANSLLGTHKKQMLKKSLQKEAIEREKRMNQTMNKLSLYKRAQKDRQLEELGRKTASVRYAMPRGEGGEVIESQLEPIRWKNFTHVMHN